MFLTGIADAYIKYDVVKTLKYGFNFDTLTLGEMLKNAVSTGADIISTIIGIF